MFAYCGNNPENGCDARGEYYTPGQIHDFVVEDICENNRNKTGDDTYISYYKSILRGKKWYKYGFCDIYDTVTHEVWEVKRLSPATSCSPIAASFQLSNYVYRGLLKSHPDWKLKLGGQETTIKPNIFTKLDKDGKGMYLMGYFDVGNGLIYYDYYYIPSPDEAAMAGAAVVGLMLLLSGAGAVSAVPTLALLAA